MKSLALVLAAFLGVTVQTGFAAGGPPDTWRARPPIHVRRAATSAPTGYSPSQIRHAYGFDQVSRDGTGQIIAIVDAFDDPTVASDLQTFIKTFGLPGMKGLPNTPSCTVAAGPHPCFQKVYAQKKPRTNGGWALEISLDVQWAHAIAPGADILLVEANDNSFSNLLGAVDVAVNMGAKVVSMSWGGSEFSFESLFDFHFNHAGVSFTAASGDSGTGVIYPAASPYVLAVGGSTLQLNPVNGEVLSETAWNGSGGGLSAAEAEPGYQSNYSIPFTGGRRGVPDVAYNADPNTGVPVFDSTPFNGQTGWFQVGGTSAGAPQWAALIALADQGRTTGLSTSSDLTSSPEYSAAAPPFSTLYASNYSDILSGTNGTCTICSAGPGYDFVTGLGSPHANNLVPYLQTH